MTTQVLSEEAIHYVAAFLERYEDKYPTKSHVDALREFRLLSNNLLDELGKPTVVSVRRHRFKHD